MTKKAAIAAAALAAAAAMLLAVLRWRGTAVEAWRVSRTTVRPVVAAAGEIRPPESVPVFPRVIGRVAKVLVREGDRVRAGDSLFELDGKAYAAQAAQARSAAALAEENARRAEESIEAASRKLDAARGLVGKRLASREYLAAARLDVEKAVRERDSAAAALADARARLASAREALARTRVDAPVSGNVVDLRVRTGETVRENEAVAAIADPGALRAVVEAPAGAAGAIAPGMPARVTAAGVTAAGAVREVAAPNKSGGSTYLTVMIALSSAPAALRPGMPARARIEGEPRPGVLAVPLSALVRPSGAAPGAFVWTIAGARVRRRAIAVAAAGDRLAEVASGLREGETIVGGPASAVARLEEGDHVRIETRKGE